MRQTTYIYFIYRVPQQKCSNPKWVSAIANICMYKAFTIKILTMYLQTMSIKIKSAEIKCATIDLIWHGIDMHLAIT